MYSSIGSPENAPLASSDSINFFRTFVSLTNYLPFYLTFRKSVSCMKNGVSLLDGAAYDFEDPRYSLQFVYSHS